MWPECHLQNIGQTGFALLGPKIKPTHGGMMVLVVEYYSVIWTQSCVVDQAERHSIQLRPWCPPIVMVKIADISRLRLQGFSGVLKRYPVRKYHTFGGDIIRIPTRFGFKVSVIERLKGWDLSSALVVEVVDLGGIYADLTVQDIPPTSVHFEHLILFQVKSS